MTSTYYGSLQEDSREGHEVKKKPDFSSTKLKTFLMCERQMLVLLIVKGKS